MVMQRRRLKWFWGGGYLNTGTVMEGVCNHFRMQNMQ